MIDNEKLTVYLPPTTRATARRLASERGKSISSIMDSAVRALDAIYGAERTGRCAGITDDPAKLDTLILAL